MTEQRVVEFLTPKRNKPSPISEYWVKSNLGKIMALM